MNINLNSFRAIAGNDTSIGYAVLDSKGTGLEKADNHKHLTSRNIKPLESDQNATLRQRFFDLIKIHLESEQGGNIMLQEFLDSISKELGIKEGVVSNKPLERRTIRAVFSAMDVFKAVESSDDEVKLTKKEQGVYDLFSKANFADDKTDPGDLMRLAGAVKRVKNGETLAESVTVGGTKVTLAGDRNKITGKITIKALFSSGIVDVDLNGGFLEGAMRKSFENPSKLSKLALNRNLAALEDMLENQPLLSPVSVGVARLARTLIFSKFPKGVNNELIDQLSPRGMVQIAQYVANGSYRKVENMNEAVSIKLGKYNSLTGEKRNLGKCNELGQRIDQNINSAENDALVEKFLSMEEEKQNRVQFNESVRVPARQSETLCDQEVNQILDKYNWGVTTVINNFVGTSVGNIVSSVFSSKNAEGKVEDGGQFISGPLGEDDIDACKKLFDKNLQSDTDDLSVICVKVADGQTIIIDPKVEKNDEAKVEQKGEPKAEAKDQKVDENKEKLNNFVSSFKNMFTNIQNKFAKPEKFSITTDSLKIMLAGEATRRTLVRIMCNAGENDANLSNLGKFAPKADLLVKVLRGILSNVKLGVDQQSGKEKTLLDLFKPGNEKEALAALEKEIMPLHNAEGKAIMTLAAKAKEGFINGGTIDCVSLLRSFYGNSERAEKALTTAARLLTMNLEGNSYPEEVKKLQKDLLAAFGDLELQTSDNTKVLLKDACTMDKTSLIADALRSKVEQVFSEKDIQAARSAVADLLQDVDTWQMDKLADKPGERLKYSLDKNAAIFARLLCNPTQVMTLGEPTSDIANQMLSELKDLLMSDEMRDALRPGNEKTVEKMLLGMIHSTTLNTPLPVSKNMTLLAYAEAKINTMVNVKSREMQAVTSCMFTKMLSGAKMPDSADDVKDKFSKLSELFGKIDTSLNEVQCADEALKFLGKLPAGKTVVEFMELYDAMTESKEGGITARMDNALSLLKQLTEHPSVKVKDLVDLKAFYEKDPLAKVPSLKTLLTEVALKLPPSVSVTNFLEVIDVAYPMPKPEAEPQPVLSAQKKIDVVLNVVTVATQYGVKADEAIVLSKQLERQRPAEGESRMELADFLRTISATANFSTDNFMSFFESKTTGNGSVAKTLDCVRALKAGTKAADVLDYMTRNKADFQSALDIVQNLPASRTLDDVNTVLGKLRAANIDCTGVQVMQALKYFGESAEKVGDALVTILSEAGFIEEKKLVDGNKVVVPKQTLSFESAVHLLHYLAYDGDGRYNVFDNRLKMLDNFKYFSEKNGLKGSTGVERLLFMVLSKLSADIRMLEMNGMAEGSDLARIETEITNMIEAGGEGSSNAAIPLEVILRKAVDLLPEAQPIKVTENVENEEPSSTQELYKVTKLNTPKFDPDNGDKFPNLVQRLRMNGMNAEADEIDVAYEINGVETDGSKAQAVREMQNKLQERRLELSRQLLDKMSASATDTTKGYGQFMCKVMNSYFGSLSTVDARTMFAAACRYSKDDSPVQMLGAMLKGAGPIMQKMLQGLASIEELPKDFLAALDDMRSNLAPIPQTVVRAQLNELIEQSNGLIEKIEIDQALGAASVGQSFLCKMQLKGEDSPREVVLKMLRPDAEERLEREKAIFLKCAAEVPGMGVTFKGQLAGYLEELDLRQEAANVKAGQVYNKGEAGVSSMKLIPGVPVLKNVMIVEKAPGTTADRFMKQMGEDIDNILKDFINCGVDHGLEDGNLDAHFNEGDVLGNARKIADAQQKLIKLYEKALVQQKSLVTLAEKWANEGIYNGGFYHGDLHAGNIMLAPVIRDANGKVIGGGLTVIDFGNATQLTKDQQKAVMRMMMAATQQKTDIFMENFAVLMTPEGRAKFNENRKKGKKLDNIVEGLLNLGNSQDTEKRIFAVLQQLMLEGYEIPAAVYNFSQCTLRLQGTISQMNGVIERIRHAMFDLSKLQVDSGVDPLNDFMGDSGVDNLSLDDVNDITRVFKLETGLGSKTKLSQYLQDKIWKIFEYGDYQGKLSDPNVFTKEGFNPEAFDFSQIEKMVDRYAGALGEDRCVKLRQLLNDLKVGMRATTDNPLYLISRTLASARKAYNDTAEAQKEKSAKRTNVLNESNTVKAYRTHLKTFGKDLDFVFDGLRNHKNLHKLTRLSEYKKQKKGESLSAEEQICRNWTVSTFCETKTSEVLNIRDNKLDLGSLSLDKQIEELDKREKQLDEQARILRKDLEGTSCTYTTYKLEGKQITETSTTSTFKDMDSKVLGQIRRDFDNAAEDFKKSFILPLAEELTRLVQENILPEFREKLANGCTSTIEGSNVTVNSEAQLVPGGSSKLKDFFTAIGNVIASHLDADLLKINFGGGALDFLKSCGYFAKGIPSIASFINSYGWTLTMGSMGGMEAQIPV